MNRPHYDGGTTRIFSKQKYYFPSAKGDGSEDSFSKVMEILCEDLSFHDLAAKHHFTVILNPDWKITFKNHGSKVDGPRYSRIMKALWDNFKAVFEDYGLRLKNNYTGEMVS
jgi:hypothetical protein